MRWWLLAACTGSTPQETDCPDAIDCADPACATSPACIVDTDPVDTDVEDTDVGPPLDPAAVRVSGFATFATPIGDYWDGVDPSGDVVIAYLADPEPDPDVLLLWLGKDSGCDGASAVLPYGYGDVLVLGGPRSDITLTRDAEDFYRAPILRADFAADEAYDLRPMVTVDGSDSAADVFRFSTVIAWDGPPFRNHVAPQGDPSDLTFTWFGDIVGVKFTHVLVTAVLLAPDLTPIRTITCVADASQEELTVPPTLWTEDELAGAWGWYVGIGGLSVFDTPLDGNRGFSRILTYHAEWGQLVYAP